MVSGIDPGTTSVEPEGRTEPVAFASLPGTLRPLGYQNYLLFWVGFMVSNTGRWIEMTGSLWLVSNMTDSPILLAGLGLMRAAPGILLSPVGGVVADRVDQRRLLLVTQAASLLLSLLLGLMVAMGLVQVWMIYLQLGVQSCIQPFDLAGRQALFPRLVPTADLPTAVTLTVAAARIAKFLGPAIGGIAIASLGTASPYFINAASFVGLMVAVIAMRGVAPLPIRVSQTFKADLREGYLETMGSPLSRGIVQLEAAFGLLQVNQVMITLVSRDLLGVGPEGLGFLLAAPALGAVAGITTLIVAGSGRRQGRIALVAICAYSVAMLALASSVLFAVTFIVLALTGFLEAWVTVVRQSILQLSASAGTRGRVMANMAAVSVGVTPLSQVQTGLVTSLFGISPAIALSAITLAAVSSAIAVRNRTLWNFDRSVEHPPP